MDSTIYFDFEIVYLSGQTAQYTIDESRGDTWGFDNQRGVLQLNMRPSEHIKEEVSVIRQAIASLMIRRREEQITDDTLGAKVLTLA